MRDWRSPGARMRALANKSVRTTLQSLGRFSGLTAAETAVEPAEPVRFFGEKPGSAGTLRWHDEHRFAFSQPRPRFERLQNVMYSPEGKAWRAGRLEERYSVAPLDVASLLNAPPAQEVKTLHQGTIVEADLIYSYGDWVHCFLGSVLAAGDFLPPLLLPRQIAHKSYVLRDLEAAGIPHLACEEWMRVENVLAIRKPHPLLCWTPAEVHAFQSRYCPRRDYPAPGSAVYLGRYDLSSETVRRNFPGAEIEAALDGLGAAPIRQSQLNVLTAPELAGAADIVIGDHGSGMLNIMFWRPSVVIELYVDDWWANNTLFVADAIGVEKFCVVDVHGLTAEAIRAKVRMCLEAVGGPGVPARATS